MLTDGKQRADILVELYRQAYTNFDRRRTYEWKLSLALWTALAVFIAIALRGEAKAPNIALGVVAVLAILLHWLFIWKVKQANDTDKRKAELYEQQLNELVGVEFGPEKIGRNKYETNVNEAIKIVVGESKWGQPMFLAKGRWAILMHVGFTVLLTIAGWFVLVNLPSDSVSQKSRQVQSKVIGWSSTSIDLDDK